MDLGGVDGGWEEEKEERWDAGEGGVTVDAAYPTT